MKAYFDPSAMVTLLLQEKGWNPIAHWIAQAMPSPYLSDFGWGEFVSAVARKTREGEFTDREARLLLGDIQAYLQSWKSLKVRNRDIVEAKSLVSRFELKLRIPDAIHIVIARRAGPVLVTRDKRQLLAAGYIGLDTFDPTTSIIGE